MDQGCQRLGFLRDQSWMDDELVLFGTDKESERLGFDHAWNEVSDCIFLSCNLTGLLKEVSIDMFVCRQRTRAVGSSWKRLVDLETSRGSPLKLI